MQSQKYDMYMRIPDSRCIIGVDILDCDLTLRGRVTNFPSCLADIFVFFPGGDRIDFLGLFCQELWDIGDGIATTVGLVKTVLLGHCNTLPDN